jgi:hypothetical protein
MASTQIMMFHPTPSIGAVAIGLTKSSAIAALTNENTKAEKLFCSYPAAEYEINHGQPQKAEPRANAIDVWIGSDRNSALIPAVEKSAQPSPDTAMSSDKKTAI